MRLVLTAVFTASCLAATACSQAVPPAGEAATPEAPPIPVVALDPAKGAILPSEKAERLARQCSRISPGPVTGTWSPTRAMVADLESGLGAELDKQLAAIPDAGAKPQDYYRQYA